MLFQLMMLLVELKTKTKTPMMKVYNYALKEGVKNDFFPKLRIKYLQNIFFKIDGFPRLQLTVETSSLLPAFWVI